MKKHFVAVSLLCGVMLLTSCVHLYKSPAYSNRVANYQLSSNDYTIIGTVEASGKINTIFGIITWGGDGFKILEKKAIEIGGDDIINFNFDVKQGFILFVYNYHKWEARATVIKYKDNVVNRALFNKSKREIYSE